jgi:transcriptional regulator with XRE-family HTH domain
MIGDNIKKIRELNNLGVNELARKANISGSYISNIEKGIKTNPSIEALEKIATALNVEVEEFFKSEPVSAEKLKEWDEKYNKDEKLVKDVKDIEDTEIRRIQRARNKMDVEDRAKMMRVLKASFDDYFDDDED